MPGRKSQSSLKLDGRLPRFPAVANPTVSILIPVYNQIEVTFNCLRSISKLRDETPYEVIVLDDCSTDGDVRLLGDVENIVIQRNANNLGFLRTCNAGISAARGEFLLFLNNDTEVKQDWLDALVETFELRPDAGLVGSKLLYPDGSLQEAGGIVFRDGLAWNYGKGGAADAPAFEYLREVDYCSAASVMIRKTFMVELGGFDEAFAPAYYEDVDLAFRVREAGKKVYYQPRSELIHLEGRSCGRCERSSLKRYLAINRRKFCAKWSAVLDETACEPGDVTAARDRRKMKRILVVDNRPPLADQDAGSLRMFRLLLLLDSMGYKVSFYPKNRKRMVPYTENLQKCGIECFYHHKKKQPSGLRLKGLVKRLARRRRKRGYWMEFLEDQGDIFDYVVMSRVENMQEYLQETRDLCPSAKIIYDTVDMHHLRAQRCFEVTGNPKDAELAAKLKASELAAARQADATLVCSQVERDLLRSEIPDLNIHVVADIHEAKRGVKGHKGRADILFVGGFSHPPNADAVKYFVSEVFPLILRERPDVCFEIVGSETPDEIWAMASESIKVRGYLASLAEVYRRICVTVAPLRFGAGVKGKISQSLAHGVPVVTTWIGAEGMGLTHCENAMICEKPGEFASAVVRLLEDGELWEKLSQAGLKVADDLYSAQVAKRRLRELFASLEHRDRAPVRP